MPARPHRRWANATSRPACARRSQCWRTSRRRSRRCHHGKKATAELAEHAERSFQNDVNTKDTKDTKAIKEERNQTKGEDETTKRKTITTFNRGARRARGDSPFSCELRDLRG